MFGHNHLVIAESLLQNTDGLLIIGGGECQSSNSLKCRALKQGAKIIEFIDFRQRIIAMNDGFVRIQLHLVCTDVITA